MTDIKVIIRPFSRESSLNFNSTTHAPIDCELIKLDSNLYQVNFELKSIERHFVDIVYEGSLINHDRPIKLDTFDVNKIRAKIPNTINYGEMNIFMGKTAGAFSYIYLRFFLFQWIQQELAKETWR